MTSAQGIDISNWNPAETPAGLAGLQFAIAKATESTYFADGKFAGNWAAMTAAGVARGAYHFLHPDTDGAAQARYFWSVVAPHGVRAGDMLWCDSETSSPSADSCTHAFLTELRILAPAGVLIGTYTNEAVGQTLHQTAAAFGVLWFAWPSTNTPATPGPAQYAPWGGWKFWQWGVRGIDQDAFNGTPADLTAYLHTTTPAPAPAPAPSPAPAPNPTEAIVQQLPLLQLGSTGPAVGRLQALLLVAMPTLNLGATGPRKDGVDDNFGTLTQHAVISFQAANKLNEDGKVGTTQTWPALLGVA